MNELLERLQRHFDVNNINVLKPGMTTLKIGKDSAEILIRELRDREGYTHLNFITCIDYIEDGIFTLVYMLHNYDSKHTLGVHVDIDRGAVGAATGGSGSADEDVALKARNNNAAAESLRLTAKHNLELGIVDAVIEVDQFPVRQI